MSGWLSSMTSAVTGALGYGAAEQPPYDCAWPPKEITDLSAAAALAELHQQQVTDLQNDKAWDLITNYKDPEGGDLHLFTRPQFGTYHCLKATFSLNGVAPEQFIALVGSSNIKVRQQFSADCVGLVKLESPAPNVELVHAHYWAPPPVAGRDFCFLVGHKQNADGSFDLWGCSVASKDKCPMAEGMTNVRGASLWGWHLVPVGDSMLVSYVNCFDPRGWTPSFLLAWLKTTAAKEFCVIRSVLHGKEAKVVQTGLSEVGLSEEEIQKEVKAQQATA